MTLENLQTVLKALNNSLPPSSNLTGMTWMLERLDAIRILQDEIAKYGQPKGEIVISKQGEHFTTEQGIGRDCVVKSYEGHCNQEVGEVYVPNPPVANLLMIAQYEAQR